MSSRKSALGAAVDATKPVKTPAEIKAEMRKTMDGSPAAANPPEIPAGRPAGKDKPAAAEVPEQEAPPEITAGAEENPEPAPALAAVMPSADNSIFPIIAEQLAKADWPMVFELPKDDPFNRCGDVVIKSWRIPADISEAWDEFMQKYFPRKVKEVLIIRKILHLFMQSVKEAEDRQAQS